MGTNKERIEQLECGLGAVQEGLHRIEFGMNDKLHHLEETLNRLSNVLLSNSESSNHSNQPPRKPRWRSADRLVKISQARISTLL